MKRLVHLAPYGLPHSGSFVPFMRTVLETAQQRGWAVEAVLPSGARGRPWMEGFHEAGIPVDFADGTRLQLTRWLRDRFDDGQEPTILHTHFTVYDIPAALIGRGRPHMHVYWHLHTVLSSRPRAVVANALKFLIFGRYVERILTPSADVASEVRRRFGKSAKVSVFPNPVDPSVFPALSREQRTAFREELGVPDDAQVLLHFGRDWQIKDGDVFLDALRVLVNQGRSVIGLVNQGGEEATSGAARRGLERHVKLTGLLAQPQKLYGAADVMVASSRGEGMPYTVAEALCSGVPVVASDLPGHRYLGDELEACSIVPRDAGRFASAVEAFLDMDADETARLCATAREWIVERLDVRVAAARLVEDYEQTIRDSSTQPQIAPR